jgi:hypothetical protein
MKAVGYLRLDARAAVRTLAEMDLVWEGTAVQTGGVAGGTMGSLAVRERVLCTMEVGTTTLGAAVRVNWTFGCAMGDTTLGDVGRVKLTFLGVVSTLGDLGGVGGMIAGGKGARGWRQRLVFQVVSLVVGKAAGVEGLLAKLW